MKTKSKTTKKKKPKKNPTRTQPLAGEHDNVNYNDCYERFLHQLP